MIERRNCSSSIFSARHSAIFGSAQSASNHRTSTFTLLRTNAYSEKQSLNSSTFEAYRPSIGLIAVIMTKLLKNNVLRISEYSSLGLLVQDH